MSFVTKCAHEVRFTAKYKNGDDVKGKWLQNAFTVIFPE